MSGSIAYATCHPTIGVFTTMTLSTIFNELQIIFLTKFTNLISISDTTIKVYDSNCFGLRSYNCLYETVIYLKSICFWFYEHWYKVILCNSKNGCNIGVCRNYHLITRLHHSHLDVRAENPDKSIKSVSTTDSILTADKLRVILLKLLVFFTLKIPTSINYTSYCLVNLSSMKSGYVL